MTSYKLSLWTAGAASRWRPWAGSVLVAMATAGIAAPCEAQLTLMPAKDSITVTGMTPLGRVAVIGAHREEAKYSGIIHTFSMLIRDLDGDGTETVPFEPAMHPKAVLIGVELATDRTALSVPNGVDPVQRSLSSSAATAGGTPEEPTITVPGSWALGLLVRDDGRAWVVEVAEGRPDSWDQLLDGQTQVPWIAWQPLGHGLEILSPKDPGDLVFFITPEWLEFWEGTP